MWIFLRFERNKSGFYFTKIFHRISFFSHQVSWILTVDIFTRFRCRNTWWYNCCTWCKHLQYSMYSYVTVNHPKMLVTSHLVYIVYKLLVQNFHCMAWDLELLNFNNLDCSKTIDVHLPSKTSLKMLQFLDIKNESLAKICKQFL